MKLLTLIKFQICIKMMEFRNYYFEVRTNKKKLKRKTIIDIQGMFSFPLNCEYYSPSGNRTLVFRVTGGVESTILTRTKKMFRISVHILKLIFAKSMN